MTGARRRVLRRAVLLALLLLVVLVPLGLWGLDRLRSGPGLPRADVALPGLTAPVELLVDSLGIPHLWGERLEDVVFAQGWITARDRLWQIELFRRSAQGRLSEIFGETTRSTDRFLRQLGMARAAERGMDALSAEERRLIEAYAAGVNAAIDGWRGPLPPEFLVLRFRPEPWRPADVLALEKIMAWDLTAYDQSLTLTRSLQELGERDVERVWPRYPDWAPTIVEGWPEGGRERWLEGPASFGEPWPTDAPATSGARGGARSGAPGAHRAVDPRVLAAARAPGPARALLEAAQASRASNAWVVGGARSRSGKPLLANDMHLALDQPTLWYLVGLHAPGFDVVGMSLPGTPGVVAGHNAAVAWGFTNAAADDMDLVLERVDPADTTRYLTPDGSEPFRTTRELVRVRGVEAPDTVLVRETRHGPVMSNLASLAGGDLLALRWAAHDPSRSLGAILGLNRAESVEDVIAALPGFRNPHQNVVFADTAGRWGYWMAGRVPLRGGREDRPPPTTAVPGWSGAWDWSGDLPFSRHPHVLEPERGFVVTANHRQQRGGDGGLVTDDTWSEPYRAIRIEELIEARPVHDAGSMLAIQLDVGSAFATRYGGLAAWAFERAGRADDAAALRVWDGLATLDSREATLFHAWLEEVRAAFRRDVWGAAEGYAPTAAVAAALDRGDLDADTLAAAAGRVAPSPAPWGEAHLLDVDHALSGVPIVARLLRLGRMDVPREGAPHSPNVAAYAGRRPPFRVTSGPSQRHVVDLGDVDGAGGFVLPGGQSGWPGSPHAWDQFELWRQGRLVPLPLDRGRVEARTARTVRLVPAGPDDR